MTVHFFTTAYRFSHNKEPRGEGYWGFTFGKSDCMDNVFWKNGSYSEAKKAAAVEAKKRGENFVHVCP